MRKPLIIINDNGKQHMADIPWNLDATLIDDAGGPELTGSLHSFALGCTWNFIRSRTFAYGEALGSKAGGTEPSFAAP